MKGGDISGKLLATEPEGLFNPRQVTLLGGAKVGLRTDFKWAAVEPPFSKGEMFLETETTELLLAPRHHGFDLNALSPFPLDVYICLVNNQSLSMASELAADNVSILAWAMILPEGDERENLDEIYKSIKDTRGNVQYINPVHQ